jgi:arylsulfatase A-like enzyme
MDAKQETRNFVRSYLASITFVDAQIGRLLDALEASPHADNTLVVLWGDNGYHLGEKEITGKNSLWDEATQVPLIFAGPGVPSDAVVTAPAELLDIYPTLIELAGLPRKTELDGLSLVPQMRDPTAPRERPAITTAGGPGNHAIRTERYRYIVYADGSEEFYDMHSDPHAWTNLAADAEFRTIKKELKVWVPARCAAPIPRSKNRLSEIKDGVFLWDSQPQPAKAPIPGMDQDEPRTAPAGS